ncbi:uncharacterized protein DUF4376 [Rhizobium azibense]|nr:uncharacterized protein DUF4376 [Rhizobium azibense]
MTAQFRNAKWLPSGAIEMEKFHEGLQQWIPFAAWPEDPDPEVVELFDAAKDTALPYLPETSEPTLTDVDAERDRRIVSGFVFNGVLFQSRDQDRENLMGACTAAVAAMMIGAQPGDLRWHGGAQDFTWIAADNSEIPLDAQGMFALGKAAMEHKEKHIRAGRLIKNMNPIPADYAVGTYWI